MSEVKIVDSIPATKWDLQAYQFPVELTADDVEAMRAGKFIEISINEGEYQVYLMYWEGHADELAG